MPSLPEDERARLARRYAEMPEAELSALAEKAYSLTEVARGLLQAEISRRGLALAVQTSPTDPNSDPQLIVLRKYRELPDAWVAQSVLDSAEIESTLFDENILRLNQFYSYLVRELKLMVNSEDAEDALALLDAKPPDLSSRQPANTFSRDACNASRLLFLISHSMRMCPTR